MALAASTTSQTLAQSAPATSATSEHTTRLILLGTGGGPVVRVSRAQSANLLVVDGRPYLIDCGEGTVRRLAAAGFESSDITRVFLTHLHIDHTSGLPSLLEYNWVSGKHQPVELYGPPGTEALTKAILDVAAITTSIHQAEFPPQYPSIATLVQAHDNVVTAKKLVYQDDRVRVFAVENTHFALIHTLTPTYGALKSYAYRFETPDRTFVFTGDTGPSDAVADLARGADVLVSEVINTDLIMDFLKKNFHSTDQQLAALVQHMHQEHLEPAEVGKLATKAGVKMVVLSHIAPGLEDERDSLPYSNGVRKYYKGPVVAGQDLEQF